MRLPLPKTFFKVFFFTLLCIGQIASGQTIKTIGAGGDYTTVKTAFDAINAGTITGAITLKIISNTTETATASLSASGVGSANYTNLNIYPTSVGVSITGAMAAPLINLNGADNVTIDGRVDRIGSSKSLTINNSNPSATAGTSTIRFFADATNNVVQYCNLQGSATGAFGGTIFFSTGSISGNDNNLIFNNNIEPSGANLPSFGVYSEGTSITVDNSNNSVSANNIRDYFNGSSTGSAGVRLFSNSSDWTISSNRFYQTSSRVVAAAGSQGAINISTPSGGNYDVADNVIGYSAVDGTGISSYTGDFAYRFRGIYIYASTVTTSNLQGNIVAGISITNSTAIALPGAFSGIAILEGKVNVGTTTANTIGATTGTGAISVTSSTTQTNITGILATSTSTVNIQNNKIGSISTGGTAAVGYIFNGIYTAGAAGNYTISGNTIGNATANSISIGTAGVTTAACTYNGINNAATGSIAITGNTIQNASVLGTGISNYSAITNTAAASSLTIANNNIFSGLNTGSGGANVRGLLISNGTLVNVYQNLISGLTGNGITTGSITGMVFSAGTTINAYQNTISGLTGNGITTGSINGMVFSAGTSSNVYQNIINGLTGNGVTTGTINGISITGGSTINTYRNKIYDFSTSSTGFTGTVNGIIVSGNSANLNVSIHNNIIGDLRVTAGSGVELIRGLSITSGGATSNNYVYYNTIYLNASSTGTNFGTSGIYHANTSTLDLRNNIIVNNSVPKGAGRTVAYRRSSANLSNYSTNSNNNLFYAGTASAYNLLFHDYNSSFDQTLTTYKTRMSTRDQASISVLPSFSSIIGNDAAYLHLANTNCDINGAGTPIAGFTTDFDNETRNSTTPDIGADEFDPAPGLEPAMPGLISGTTNQVPNLDNQTYSIAAVANASTYTWTVPTGWTITSGNGTASIMVTTGGAGQNGSITVSAGNGCGNSAFSTLAVTVNVIAKISGTIFEDINYGGGAGRSKTASSGITRLGARVELYTTTGEFSAFTTTDASGNYSLSVANSGNYYIRVINSSVSSSRVGYTSQCLPVQTFRTDASSGAAIAMNNWVGGTDPTVADAGNGSAGATLNTSTFAFSAVQTGLAQSVSKVVISNSDISNVDFGFNFNTIVNTNNAGQGSLRQFVTNANLLENTALEIVSQTAGLDVSIFMISNGTAVPGLRSGLANQLISGVASINITSALPTLTTSGTSIDATTQTTNIGNTNPGVVGTGGTVGVDSILLPQYERPEVAVNAVNAIRFSPLTINGDVSTILIKGFAMYNGRNLINLNGGIGSNRVIKNMFVGTLADGSDPGLMRNNGLGIRGNSAAKVTVEECYVGWNGESGILGSSTTSELSVQYCEVFGNGWNSGGHDGIDIDGINSVIKYNLSRDNTTQSGNSIVGAGNGIECGSTTYGGDNNNLIENNTVKNNTTAGVALRGGVNDITVNKNIISSNDVGILVTREGANTNNHKFSQNNIYSNISAAIFLGENFTAGSSFALNDGLKNSALANNGMDYPVFTAATLNSGILTVSGYVGSAPGQSLFANSTVEVYIGESDVIGNATGKTYLGVLTTDANGNFSGTLSGAGLTNGDKITGIATDNTNNSSVFGLNFVVVECATTPGAISGKTTQCPSTTMQVYSISAVPNATSYNWTVPTGWIVTAGAGTTSITVTTGTMGQDGNIDVTAQSSCGTSAAATINIILSPLSVGGTITGETMICPGSTSGLLTLTGYTGNVIRWESSVSPFLTWTSIINTTSTYTSGIINETTQFRAVVQSGTCSEANSSIITLSSSITTWNGETWSNGLPTSTKGVIFTGNAIIGTDLSACSITVTNNAVVSVTTGFNVTVSGAVIVDTGSSLTFNNNTNLVQGGIKNLNQGNVTFIRESNSLKRLDYTLWSSPVTGTQTVRNFSPVTNVDRYYEYNTTSNIFSTVPITTTFSAGKGFLIRMPNTNPLAGYDLGNATLVFSGQFNGVPNNGNVSIPGTAGQYVGVGNPYPSAINADAFININANSGGNGTLYFWRKTNNKFQSTSPTTSYATYTLAGGVGTTLENGGFTPTVNIAVGQGFITTVPSTKSIEFNNTMRSSSNSAQFLRTKQVEKNRIWLNLFEGPAIINQIMIAYMQGATSEVDAGIDGKYFNDSATALTSNINSGEYIIQGRALPFDASDVVNLNFKTAMPGTFTIVKDHVDGLFSAGQDIYLVDAKTGNETNLQTDSYTFSATAGNDNARFSLKYQKTLSINDVNLADSSIKIYKSDSMLTVTSDKNNISSIKVFDMQGRLIAQQLNVNATSTNIKNLKSRSQTLLVKVTTINNLIVTKKVVY